MQRKKCDQKVTQPRGIVGSSTQTKTANQSRNCILYRVEELRRLSLTGMSNNIQLRIHAASGKATYYSYTENTAGTEPIFSQCHQGL
jgi:hypothetical protein